MFGEKGRFIISGGNDKSIKVWDWSKSSNASSNSDILHSNISLKNKVISLPCTYCVYFSYLIFNESFCTLNLNLIRLIGYALHPLMQKI